MRVSCPKLQQVVRPSDHLTLDWHNLYAWSLRIPSLTRKSVCVVRVVTPLQLEDFYTITFILLNKYFCLYQCVFLLCRHCVLGWDAAVAVDIIPAVWVPVQILADVSFE